MRTYLEDVEEHTVPSSMPVLSVDYHDGVLFLAIGNVDDGYYSYEFTAKAQVSVDAATLGQIVLVAAQNEAADKERRGR